MLPPAHTAVACPINISNLRFPGRDAARILPTRKNIETRSFPCLSDQRAIESSSKTINKALYAFRINRQRSKAGEGGTFDETNELRPETRLFRNGTWTVVEKLNRFFRRKINTRVRAYGTVRLMRYSIWKIL